MSPTSNLRHFFLFLCLFHMGSIYNRPLPTAPNYPSTLTSVPSHLQHGSHVPAGFTNTIIHVDGITLSLVVGHRPRQLQTDPDGVHHQEEEDVRGIPCKGFNSR